MKKLIFIVLYSAMYQAMLANDTLYFHLSNPWNTVKDPHGKYLRKCIIEEGFCHVYDYNEKHLLVTESYYADTNFNKKLFCHKYFNEDGGWLEQTRCYLNGRLDGYFISYDKNGDTTDYDVYKEGEVIKSWSLHPEVEDSTLKALKRSEMEAEFPGGKDGWLKFLSNNLRYPSSLQDKNIKGQVIIAFTINIHGRVENVKVVKSLNPALDEEAIRVIQKSPKWKPAMQNNRNVPAQMTQSVMF